MAAPASEAKGFFGAAIGRVGRILMFLVIALLLAVVVEWIGMAFIWPDEGVEHSRRMVLSEYAALDLAVSDEAYASHRVAGLANVFVEGGYGLLVQRTGIEGLAGMVASGTGSPAVLAYAEAGLNSIQAFLLRLVVVMLALPAFVLIAMMCSVEGLTLRALRRYGGGHETAYVFHHAKRVLAPSILLPAIIYLSWPTPLSPVLVFGPALFVFSIALTLTVSKFKKFL